MVLIQAEMLFSALVMEMPFRKLYARKNAALAEVVEKEAFYEAENPYLEVEAL